MTFWDKANKLRPHNRNETLKHFMIKAMVFKLFFNAGYYVYSEYEVKHPNTKKYRVVDIKAVKMPTENNTIFVEVETTPTKKHNKELIDYYGEKNVYIIDVRKISDNLLEMEKQLKHILGL